ncbi:MAG: histone deacetylase family protein [Candidatus Woesearchaeota archaeon]
MDFLFDKRILKHNPQSSYEGAYRFDNIKTSVPSQETETRGEKYLGLIHDSRYIEMVKRASEEESFFANMNNDKNSYSCACLAVGMAIEASEKNLFSLSRPPGHHSSKHIGDGYCLFNNIAIATKKIVENGAKVAILDFDAHHGDGTQKIFLGNPEVRYFSIHEKGKWPFSGNMGWEKNCFNYPIKKGSEDNKLIEWGRIVQDYTQDFNPDIIAVSAGFDGLRGDRISDLRFSLNGFSEIGKMIGSLEKRTFAVLEGGYHNQTYECAIRFRDGFNFVSKEYKK